MSTIARHHAEWLSLLDINGPFLSMPVLLRVFPQGIEEIDPHIAAELRQAYNEWLDNQHGNRPEAAIHKMWAMYVLKTILQFEPEHLLEGSDIPSTLSATISEHNEVLVPDLAIPMQVEEAEEDVEDQKFNLLVNIYPIDQKLEGVLKGKNWKASPASRMAELLRSTGVALGIITNGEQWMLLHAPKGETSSFISWYASIWNDERLTLRAFASLLGARRFFNVPKNETLAQLFKTSLEEQHEVTEQLGYQVRRAVEVMVRALDNADQDRNRELLREVPNADVYEAALTVMMRLVFLFSAEERGLLLLGDPIYDENYAVSTLRAQLRESADKLGEGVLERRYDAWGRLLATFRAVYYGIHHERLNLPAYGGSLFDPKRYPFLEGRMLSAGYDSLPIDNRTVLHLLEALQILQVKIPGGNYEPRRLSFRALDVEQIGHVYEGLLDHTVKKAEEMILGLSGSRNNEPEIPLSVLLENHQLGESKLLKFLSEETGRTEKALKKDLSAQPDILLMQRLRSACNNDDALSQRIMPFANLIRLNDFSMPTVYLAGGHYMTSGQARRATGTHYTPRSLTEPIVAHTLEPIVYVGPAEGYPRDEWKLISPKELLALKVCDMAMGSAGFLVQVIRYLGERLVESWDKRSKDDTGKPGGLRITPNGDAASGRAGEMLIPLDDEEKMVLARRLVADRCIYGVDKNPLAVEIAKLSIWLTTMDNGRPFTFLDHALKCGDALVGADEQMFHNWAYSQSGAQFMLYATSLDEMVADAREKRRQLEELVVLDMRDMERKNELLRLANEATERIKLGADLLVGTKLIGLQENEEAALLERLLWNYTAGQIMDGYDAHRVRNLARKEKAFHWHFEFPEVFEKGGFNAFVGNPPFLGGKRIGTVLGVDYQNALKSLYSDSKGASDLSAYFFRRSYSNLKMGSSLGMISTNTIAQGDTKEVGLDVIIRQGGIIFKAIPSSPWPGTAGVFISIVYLFCGNWSGPKFIDYLQVEGIGSDLRPSSKQYNKPKILKANKGQISEGIKIHGNGFILEEEEAKFLLITDLTCKSIIQPYISGEDVNMKHNATSNRFVINFGIMSDGEAKKHKALFDIVTERVKPYRDGLSGQIHEKNYWLFWDKREAFFESISNNERFLVFSGTTKYLSLTFVSKGNVISQKVKIFSFEDFGHFALLQSNLHDIWAWKYSSTLGEGLSYSNSDAFLTFPIPKLTNTLEKVGEQYYFFRKEIMDSKKIGLTSLYNSFHNPKDNSEEILELRKLHSEMDYEALRCFGWNDLKFNHGFYTISNGLRFTIHPDVQTELLSRLYDLNQQYAAEELGGAQTPKPKVAKPKQAKPKAQPSDQTSMFTADIPELPIKAPIPLTVKPLATEFERWSRYICTQCGNSVMGFSIGEHTTSVHGGQNPGYRKA
jgi:hypothetical protein